MLAFQGVRVLHPPYVIRPNVLWLRNQKRASDKRNEARTAGRTPPEKILTPISLSGKKVKRDMAANTYWWLKEIMPFGGKKAYK